MTARPVAELPRPRVTVYLLVSMAVGTFTAAVLSVLATFIIEDLEITRAQLGLVVALNTIVGGLASPAAGRFVDRVGGGSALQALFTISVIAFLLTAAAPGYPVLLLAAVVGGLAQSLTNPATNKVIAYRYPAAQRANVTGIKQSGVQFAIFAGGVTLPSLAEWMGWRWAMVIVAAATAAGAVALFVARRGRSSGVGESLPAGSQALSGAVPWLAGYGLLMGLTGSALFFLPLFAEEELGQSVQAGGLALALAGLTAVIGRVAWARFAERGARYRSTLALIAAFAVIGPWLFTMADSAIALLWIGAVIIGASASSWNSVGMLAVIDGSAAQGAGAASGWVLLGFLVGLGVGPPIYGRTVDTSQSYTTMWLAATVFAALALLLVVVWMVADRRRAASDYAELTEPPGRG